MSLFANIEDNQVSAKDAIEQVQQQVMRGRSIGTIWFISLSIQILVTLLIYFVLSNQLYPVFRWFVAEGTHGIYKYLIVPLLVLSLLVPTVVSARGQFRWVFFFAIMKGMGYGLFLILLFRGDVLNRAPILGLLLCVVAFGSILLFIFLFPFYAIAIKLSIKHHLLTSISKKNDRATLFDLLVVYFGDETKNRPLTINERISAYLGKLRNTKLFVSIFGDPLLSHAVISAYQERTDVIAQQLINHSELGTQESLNCLKDLRFAFEDEFNIHNLADRIVSNRRSGLEIERAKIVFLLAAQSVPLGKDEIGFNEELVQIFELLEDVASKTQDSLADSLNEIKTGLQEEDPKHIFHSQDYSYSVEDKQYSKAISAIFLERMNFVTWASNLTEHLDEFGNIEEIGFSDDSEPILHLAKARIHASIASELSAQNSCGGEINQYWIKSLFSSVHANDHKINKYVNVHSTDLKDVSSNCEQMRSFLPSFSWPLKKIFRKLPIASGSGEFLSKGTQLVWFVVALAIVLFAYLSTWQSDSFPTLSDPFRLTNLKTTTNLSSDALSGEIFVGTESKGVHVIDVSNYKIVTESPSSTSSGPQTGAISNLVASNEKDTLAARIVNEIGLTDKGAGVDLRIAGNWLTLIAASSVSDLDASKLTDIVELTQGVVFLIDNRFIGYDEKVRELFEINVGGIDGRITSLHNFNDTLLILSGGKLYSSKLHEKRLSFRKFSHPDEFGSVVQVLITKDMEGINQVLAITETGSLHKQTQANQPNWELILGGGQWERLSRGEPEVLNVGVDQTGSHIWMIVEIGKTTYFGLRPGQSKDSDSNVTDKRFWIITPVQDINLNIEPVIHPNGLKVLIATNTNSFLFTRSNTSEWKFDNPVPIQTRQWKPLTYDFDPLISSKILITQAEVSSEQEDTTTQVVKYDFDTSFIDPVLSRESKTKLGKMTYIHKDEEGDIVFVTVDGQSQTYDPKDRKWQGDSYIFIDGQVVIDYASFKKRKLQLTQNGTLINQDKRLHEFGARTVSDIKAAWDTTNGFEVVGIDGVGWKYDLETGWSKTTDEYLINHNQIQRRSDGMLVALTKKGELLTQSHNQNWNRIEIESDNFTEIMPATDGTLIIDKDNRTYLLSSKAELEKIREGDSEGLITLPISDVATFKIGKMSYMAVSDSEGVLVYSPQDSSWKRVPIETSERYKLYERSNSSLAWGGPDTKVYRITASDMAETLFDGKKVFSFDTNSKGNCIALFKDGSVEVIQNNRKQSVVSTDTNINLGKTPDSATVLDENLIIASSEGVFSANRNGSVARYGNLAPDQIASASGLLVALVTDDTGANCYYFESNSWVPIQGIYNAVGLYQLEETILVVTENAEAYLIDSSHKTKQLLFGKREHLVGRSIDSKSVVAEFAGFIFMASATEKGIIRWSDKNPSEWLGVDDYIDRFEVVDGILFAIGAKTWKFDNKTFIKVFNDKADSLYENDGDIYLLSKGDLYIKNNDDFQKTLELRNYEAKLQNIFDVLKFPDSENLLFIETNGGLVEYNSAKRHLKRLSNGLIKTQLLDVAKINKNQFYLIYKVDKEKKIEVRSFSSPVGTLGGQIEFSSKDLSDDNLVILSNSGDVYKWSEFAKRWESVYKSSEIKNKIQIKTFIPIASKGAFALDTNGTIWKYSPGNKYPRIAIGGKNAITEQIWKWTDDSIVAYSQNKLFHLVWNTNNAKELASRINQLKETQNGLSFLIEGDVYYLSKSDFLPKLRWPLVNDRKYKRNAPVKTWRVFDENPNVLFVFNGSYLDKYDGKIGEWDSIASWTGTYKNPIIEKLDSGELAVLHDHGYLVVGSNSYQSDERPIINKGEIFHLSKGDLMKGGLQQTRSWESDNPMDFAAWNSKEASEGIKTYQIADAKYFVGDNTTLLIRGSDRKVWNKGVSHADRITAYNAKKIIGVDGLLLLDNQSGILYFFLENGSARIIFKDRILINARLLKAPNGAIVKSSDNRILFGNSQGAVFQLQLKTDRQPSTIVAEEINREFAEINGMRRSIDPALLFIDKNRGLLINVNGKIGIRANESSDWSIVDTIHKIEDVSKVYMSEENFFIEIFQKDQLKLFRIDANSNALLPAGIKFEQDQTSYLIRNGNRLRFIEISEASPSGITGRLGLRCDEILNFKDSKSLPALMAEATRRFSVDNNISPIVKGIFPEIIDGYLKIAEEENLDIQIATGRYRSKQLLNLGTFNSKLVVMLRDGSKLLLNGDVAKQMYGAIDIPRKQGGYTYDLFTKIFSRELSDGSVVLLGGIEKGSVFTTDKISQQDESFRVTSNAIYIKDQNGSVWSYANGARKLSTYPNDPIIWRQDSKGDLKWIPSMYSGVLQFQVRTSDDVDSWKETSFVDGVFEHDVPEEVQWNSGAQIKVDLGPGYLRTIDEIIENPFDINFKHYVVKIQDRKSHEVYAPFGKVSVTNGGGNFYLGNVPQQIKTPVNRFPWDEVSAIAKHNRTLFYETKSGIVEKRTNGTLSIASSVQENLFEHKRWLKSKSGMSNLIEGADGIGYACKTVGGSSFPVHWRKEYGSFDFECASGKFEKTLDSKVKISSSHSGSIETLAGPLLFDGECKILDRVDGDSPLKQKVGTIDGRLVVDRANAKNIIFKNKSLFAGGKADIPIQWQVIHGELPISQIVDVAIDSIGNLLLLSPYRIRVIANSGNKIIKDVYLRNQNEAKFSKPHSGRLSNLVKASEKIFEFNYGKWGEKDPGDWKNSKTSETSYEGELDKIKWSKSEDGNIVFKLDHVPLLFQSDGFAIDRPMRELAYVSGELIGIYDDRILHYDSDYSISNASWGADANEFIQAIDDEGLFRVVHKSSGKSYDAKAKEFDATVKLENSYQYSVFNDSGFRLNNIVFKLQTNKDSNASLTIDWHQIGGKTTRLVEYDGKFEHDTISGIEFISQSGVDWLLTSSSNYLCKRKPDNYKLIEALKLDSFMANTPRKLLSDFDGKIFMLGKNGYKEANLEGATLAISTDTRAFISLRCKTSDWSVKWDESGKLNFYDSSDSKMYKPLIDGYFRGDQIYGSAYSKKGLITFLTNTGFQNRLDRSHFGPSLDFLTDEFEVRVFRRDSAANVVSSKLNSQYYQLDLETYKSDNVSKLINRNPVITNSIKVTWNPEFNNRAQFSFKTDFLSTRDAYDYAVDSGKLLFDWDVAQGASELSGKALIYHKDSLSIFGSTLQDSVYDNPSNESFTSTTEICFSEKFHDKNKLNTAYIKNGDLQNSLLRSLQGE